MKGYLSSNPLSLLRESDVKKIERLEECDDLDFSRAVEILDLDPATDFRNSDLAGICLDGVDMSVFDFTGSVISNKGPASLSEDGNYHSRPLGGGNLERIKLDSFFVNDEVIAWLKISPDQTKFVYSNQSGKIVLCSLSPLSVIQEFLIEKPVVYLDFDAHVENIIAVMIDGKVLALSCFSGEVALIGMVDVPSFIGGGVLGSEFYALMSVDWDEVFIYSPKHDITSPMKIKRSSRETIFGYGFSDDLARLMIFDRSIIEVWSAPDGKNLTCIDIPSEDLKEAVLSPDGKLIAARAYTGEIKIFDVGSADFSKKADFVKGEFDRILFASYRWLLTKGFDDEATIWDLERGNVVFRERLPVSVDSFDAVGKYFIIDDKNGRVRSYEIG